MRRPWRGARAVRLAVLSGILVLGRNAEAHEVAGGGGLPALGLVAGETALFGRVCAALPCRAEEAGAADGGSARIDVPERFRKGLRGAAFETVPIGRGRMVGYVTVTDPAEGDRWVAVVAASPDGPKVLFSDVAAPGLDRTAREPKMLSPRAGSHENELLLGERSETVHLCGRPTLLSPRVLDPRDLTWKSVKVQQVGGAARASAVSLTLTKSAEPAPFSRLLSAVGASSALAAGPLAATDGDLTTFWSEARGSDGHGEFLVLRVPRDVPLTRLIISPLPLARLVPGAGPAPDLAAPRRAFLLSDDRVFRLELPEEAVPGASYSVRFPEAVKTSCLALVLDEGSRDGKGVAVTVAEVAAGTRWDDGKIDLDGLVGALAGGGEDARATAAILAGAGEKVLAAIEKGYPSLDDAGRVLALTVLDQLPCEDTAGTYARALSSKYEAESAHAAARLARCGRRAAKPLLAIVADPKDPARFRAAEELSVLAPDLLLPLLARRGGEESPAVRKALRSALVRAARAERAEAVVAALLDDATLLPGRTLELLRATAPLLGKPELAAAAEGALQRVAPLDAPFDVRFLALGPAAILAASGSEKSLARLSAALAEPDLRLRVEAVRALGSLPSQRQVVLGLVRDPEPRVRQALASALRVLDDKPARDALLSLLADEWTFVRSAAFESLARVSADPAVDAALVAALSKERVPAAQARLVDAVGQRRLFAAGPPLLVLSGGDRTTLDVRVRATVALGRVCHTPAVESLVVVANRGLAPFAERDDATLGHAALAALARLDAAAGPSGIASRLSAEARKVLPEIKAVLDPEDRCGVVARSAGADVPPFTAAGAQLTQSGGRGTPSPSWPIKSSSRARQGSSERASCESSSTAGSTSRRSSARPPACALSPASRPIFSRSCRAT